MSGSTIAHRTPVDVVRGACPAWPVQDGFVVPEQPHADHEPSYARLVCKNIAPGANAHVMFRPQVPFRPTRLAVDHDCLDLLVNGICVGKNSYLCSSNPVLAGAWPTLPFELSPKRYEEWFERLSTPFDVCQISQLVNVHVTNPHPEPRPFRATLWGVAVADADGVRSPVPPKPKDRQGLYCLGIGNRDDREGVTFFGTQSQLTLKLDSLVLRPEEGVHVVALRVGGKRHPFSHPIPSSVFAPHPFGLSIAEQAQWTEAHDLIASLPTLHISQVLALELKVMRPSPLILGAWRGKADY